MVQFLEKHRDTIIIALVTSVIAGLIVAYVIHRIRISGEKLEKRIKEELLPLDSWEKIIAYQNDRNLKMMQAIRVSVSAIFFILTGFFIAMVRGTEVASTLTIICLVLASVLTIPGMKHFIRAGEMDAISNKAREIMKRVEEYELSTESEPTDENIT